ncbi:MAG: peptidylprolyl isomerase [Chitinophagales bacterium]
MRVEFSRPILLVIFFSLCLVQSAVSQTLFTYGDHQVTKDEFLKAYNKNNTTAKPTEKSYQDYIDLYIRYKLKVQAAYDQKLDSLSTLAMEMQNYRNQIANSYMNDEAYLDKLTNEAFARSQKDIHLSQIFIASAASASPADTLKAFQKLSLVKEGLKKGESFEMLAEKYSDDPFAKSNHGYIGYITVFALPYPLETLAYQTLPGKYSSVYKSKGGYHIFKNLGERKGLGKIRAAQILLIFPINATDAGKAEVKMRSDSIYNALLKGADFGELALKFSGDNLSYQQKGEMPIFGVGRYDQAFEEAAFSISKDGEISKPVLTNFGYHIIKRLARIPVSPTKTKETMESLKLQVMADPRIEVAKEAMSQKIFGMIGFSEKHFDENQLWVYTDSALQNKKRPSFPSLGETTLLFSFTKKNYTVSDWISYRISIKNLVALNQGKSNRALLDQFERTAALEYYRSHLEEYNKEFDTQLREFKDGNLLFEVMQRKIWDKASSDTSGLRKYYESHKNKYWWEPSADAIQFTCNSENTAEAIRKAMSRGTSGWKRLVDSTNGLAQADSGRFELVQLPPADQGGLKEGQFSSMSKNPNDNTVVFAYIIKRYPERMPRDFDDAHGLVINDYQGYLEDEWINELKKKYPVKVNVAVQKSLPK